MYCSEHTYAKVLWFNTCTRAPVYGLWIFVMIGDLDAFRGDYEFDGSAIVYCPSRKEAERVSSELYKLGVLCGVYHAGMGIAQRRETQQRFMRDEIQVAMSRFQNARVDGRHLALSGIRALTHAASLLISVHRRHCCFWDGNKQGGYPQGHPLWGPERDGVVLPGDRPCGKGRAA